MRDFFFLISACGTNFRNGHFKMRLNVNKSKLLHPICTSSKVDSSLSFLSNLLGVILEGTVTLSLTNRWIHLLMKGTGSTMAAGWFPVLGGLFLSLFLLLLLVLRLQATLVAINWQSAI